jgi:hypothetical protein
VDQQTREHIDLAERNRDLARALLAPAISGSLQPSPYEWIAVIAFYAAVHYVSAYLWEKHREVIDEHPKRAARVRTEGILKRCSPQYGRLSNAGWNARYTRGFQMSRQDAERLVNFDLANVESVVMAAI